MNSAVSRVRNTLTPIICAATASSFTAMQFLPNCDRVKLCANSSAITTATTVIGRFVMAGMPVKP